MPNGESQWITGEAARADGHLWRARACAVLTGIGTVLADDPLLNVRFDTPAHPPVERQPTLVLIDSKLEISLTAKLLQPTNATSSNLDFFSKSQFRKRSAAQRVMR